MIHFLADIQKIVQDQVWVLEIKAIENLNFLDTLIIIK